MAEKLLKVNKRKIVPSDTGRARTPAAPDLADGRAAAPRTPDSAAGRAASMRLPRKRLRARDGGACLSVWSPVKGTTPQLEKIESIVMSIATFGRNRKMPIAKAYDYLCTYAGLNFLDEHYSITRCYSDEMMDESLSMVCRNHGGTVK